MMNVIGQGSKRFNSHWNKNMAGRETVILGRLPLCSGRRGAYGMFALRDTEEAVSVWTTVTSYVADCHGTKVTPSGLFPSFLLRPFGSLVADTSARIRAR